MKSLKECYEIAKKYHTYWTGIPGDRRHMCIAAEDAFNDGALTHSELLAVKGDAMTLVNVHDPSLATLKSALSCAYDIEFTDDEVKAFWDEYIDNLENQDE